MVQVRVDGADRVQRKFETLALSTKREMKADGLAVLDVIQANMPDYPSPPPSSKYVRTLNLFAALRATEGDHPMALSKVKMLGDDAVVTVGVGGYGPYVVGVEQARIHQGRWWKLVQYVRSMTPTVKHTLLRRTSERIASAGFGM